MAESNDKTHDVTLYEEGGVNPVDVINDGGVRRLAVDAKLGASGNFGTPRHTYGDTTSSTICSHTVNTGKIGLIYSWGFSIYSGVSQVELQIAGTAKDKMYQGDSSQGQRGTNSIRYTIPIQATAGQVVRLQRTGGDTGKSRAGFIEIVEIDA
jgi:hypothetical protein